MKVFSSRTTADEKHLIIEVNLPEPFSERVGPHFESSYHVLCARVLGLSYKDFLHYCYYQKAEIVGKKGYTHPIWKIEDASKIEEVIKTLNSNWKAIEVFLKGKM